MLGFFNLFSVIWPVAATITPLVVGAGVLWLRSQFPTKAELTSLSAKVDGMPGQEGFDRLSSKVDGLVTQQTATSTRIEALAKDIEDPPTRVELLQSFADMSGRVGRLEAQTAGVETQLKTTNQYLQIIVERGLK